VAATASAVLSGGAAGKAPAPANNSAAPPPNAAPLANGEPGAAAPLAGAGVTLSSDAVRNQQTQQRRQLKGAEEVSDGSEVTDSEMLDAQLNAAAVAVRSVPPFNKPPSSSLLLSPGPSGFVSGIFVSLRWTSSDAKYSVPT